MSFFSRLLECAKVRRFAETLWQLVPQLPPILVQKSCTALLTCLHFCLLVGTVGMLVLRKTATLPAALSGVLSRRRAVVSQRGLTKVGETSGSKQVRMHRKKMIFRSFEERTQVDQNPTACAPRLALRPFRPAAAADKKAKTARDTLGEGRGYSRAAFLVGELGHLSMKKRRLQTVYIADS
eukprot:GHVT01099751.1.p1 GENE.GHVT01099751.1~~GHVT01099751.1.p1  ORF type:complete len:181 (+),score=19.19 GHVT01099751.1:402-944(+)